MKISVFFLALLFLPVAACIPSKKAKAKIQKYSFPSDWAGEWTGILEVFAAGKKVQSLPMTLTILPQGDSIQWQINYDTLEAKVYSLHPVNPAKGIYKVDEHNSIVIETYLFDNKLIAHYLVSDNNIIVTETLTGDRLLFEVMMSLTGPVSTSGGTVMGADTVPEVKTFPVKVYQRALLVRDDG